MENNNNQTSLKSGSLGERERFSKCDSLETFSVITDKYQVGRHIKSPLTRNESLNASGFSILIRAVDSIVGSIWRYLLNKTLLGICDEECLTSVDDSFYGESCADECLTGVDDSFYDYFSERNHLRSINFKLSQDESVTSRNPYDRYLPSGDEIVCDAFEILLREPYDDDQVDIFQGNVSKIEHSQQIENWDCGESCLRSNGFTVVKKRR